MSEAIEVVRHPRARGWKLKLDPVSGRARLTIPPRARLADALAWAQGQQGWIAAQRARLPQAQPFVPGACIPLGDGMLEIDANPNPLRSVLTPQLARPVEGACHLGDAPGIGVTPDLQELAEVAARGC